MSSVTVPSRRIWPIGFIFVGAAGAMVGYGRWSESSSPERLRTIIKREFAAQVNREFGAAVVNEADVQVDDLNILKTKSRSSMGEASGTLILQRHSFAAYGGDGSPTFRTSGKARFTFTAAFSRDRESLSIARQLGPIKETLRFGWFQSLRLLPGDGEIPFNVSGEFKPFWKAMESAAPNDLFNLQVLQVDPNSWVRRSLLWEDSKHAMAARIMRSEGRQSEAADYLIANLNSHDAWKAPLVGGEVSKLVADLAQHDSKDPRIAELKRLTLLRTL